MLFQGSRDVQVLTIDWMCLLFRLPRPRQSWNTPPDPPSSCAKHAHLPHDASEPPTPALRRHRKRKVLEMWFQLRVQARFRSSWRKQQNDRKLWRSSGGGRRKASGRTWVATTDARKLQDWRLKKRKRSVRRWSTPMHCSWKLHRRSQTLLSSTTTPTRRVSTTSSTLVSSLFRNSSPCSAPLPEVVTRLTDRHVTSAGCR